MAVFGNAGTVGFHQLVFAIGAARSSVANEQTVPVAYGSNRIHLRLLNDGTELHYQYSNMGAGGPWEDWYSELSPSGLDHYGFLFGNEYNAGNSYNQAIVFENNLSTALTRQSVTGATGNGVTVVVTVAVVSGFDVGDTVSVHGMVGNTTANTTNGNGAFAGGNLVTAIDRVNNKLTFGGVTGNGAWTSGGVITNLSK